MTEENPIFPVDEFQDALAEVFSAQALAQIATLRALGQPDVTLDNIPTLTPSQQTARESADSWYDDLQPRIIQAFTHAKTFSNTVATVAESDIDELVKNINDPAGKQKLGEVVGLFRDDADKAGAAAAETASVLHTFARGLSSDLSNLHVIITQANEYYNTPRTEQLLTELQALGTAVSQANTDLVTTAARFLAASGGGAAPVAAQLTSTFTGSDVVLAAQPVVTVPGGQVDAQIKNRDTLAQDYIGELAELHTLESRVAVLHGIGSTYDALTDQAAATAQTLILLRGTWRSVSNHLQGLIDASQGTVDAGTAALIKSRLKAFLGEAAALKSVADFYEQSAGVAAIADEEVALQLRLARSWVGRPVDGSVFASYLAQQQARRS